MKTTEDLFRESIAQYIQLKSEASLLSESMRNLAPDEILRRCTDLKNQHRDQIKIDSFMIEIIIDFGPKILEKAYIHEYKHALDSAISACDTVSLEANKILQDLNASHLLLSDEAIHA